MRPNRSLVFGVLIFIVSFFVGGHKAAVSAGSPTGITVSPAFQQVTVPAGAEKQPVTFKITNDKAVSQTISLSAADFNTLNESGGLFFVGTNPTELQKKYGLAKWFSISQKQITIQPKQTQTINADILDLPDMGGGGHYGALLIKIANSVAEPGRNNKVGIEPIASSLMFVTKVGGDTHNLSLANISFKHSVSKLPESVVLKFSNTGNTHLVPRGIVKLVNPNGKLISQGIINGSSDIILPQTNRNYTVALQNISLSSKPGKYKLYVDFRFDGIDQPRGYQTSFWYLPIATLALPIVIIILFIGIGAYIMRNRKSNKQTK